MKEVFIRMNVYLFAFALVAGSAQAGKVRTLITLDGDSPKAGLAKSWKKVGDGKYQFTLDTSKEIAKGKTLNSAFVKASVEKKLKKKGVEVSISSVDAVEITYTGDEKTFLKNIAKTRIRASRSVQLALESGVSDSGIRARIAARRPKDGEVKGRIIRVNSKDLHIWVLEKGKKKVPAALGRGKLAKVTPQGGMKEVKPYKKGDTVFFQPVKDQNGVWLATGFTQK